MGSTCWQTRRPGLRAHRPCLRYSPHSHTLLIKNYFKTQPLHASFVREKKLKAARSFEAAVVDRYGGLDRASQCAPSLHLNRIPCVTLRDELLTAVEDSGETIRALESVAHVVLVGCVCE